MKLCVTERLRCNKNMFHKLYVLKDSFLILLLLSILIVSSCQTETPDFEITQTESTQTQEFITVEVDNCSGLLPKLYTYRYPFIGNTVGVENQRPNGGEPFKSVSRRIWRMYGEQAEKVRVTVPAATKREFTFVVTTITYRGIVSGAVIDKNKVVPDQDAIYFYPFTASIVANSYQDIPCPSK